MTACDCNLKKFLLEFVLISNLAYVLSRSLPAGNIPYQVAPLSIPYPFQGNTALRTGYYNPQLTHTYPPPEPAGTFYDSKRGILRSFPGGGVPVLVDYHKRCSGGFFGIKPHPNQRQYYYVCKPDCVIFGRCQNLQFFDGTKGQCSPYPTPEFTPVCTKPGRFPILSDCTTYYRCDAQLKPRIYACPRNTVFSPREAKCICGAQCNPTEVSTHGSHIPQDCEHKFPPCLQDGTFRAPTDCSLYYTCVMQSKGIYLQTRFKCPDLTFFDTARQVCRPQYEVACDSIQLSELVYPRPPPLLHLPVIYPPHYALASLEDTEYPAEYSMSCSKEDTYGSRVDSTEALYYTQSPVIDSTSSTSVSATPTTIGSPSTTSITTVIPTAASSPTASSADVTIITALPTTPAEQSTSQTSPATSSSTTLSAASSPTTTEPTSGATTIAATTTATSTTAPSTTTEAAASSMETPSSEETALRTLPFINTIPRGEPHQPQPSILPDLLTREPPSSSTDEIFTEGLGSTSSSTVTSAETEASTSNISPTSTSSPSMSTDPTSSSPSTSASTISTNPTSTSTDPALPTNPATKNPMPTTTADMATASSSLQPGYTTSTASSEPVSSTNSAMSTASTLSSSTTTMPPITSSSPTGETTSTSAQTTTTTTAIPSTTSTRSTAASTDFIQNTINPSEISNTNTNINNPITNEIRSIRSHTPAESVIEQRNNDNADYTDLTLQEVENVVYSDEYDSDLATTENALKDKFTEEVGIKITELSPITSTDVTQKVPESAKQMGEARNQDVLPNDALEIEDMEDVVNELRMHKGRSDVSYYEDDMEYNEVLSTSQKTTTTSEETVVSKQAPVTKDLHTTSHSNKLEEKGEESITNFELHDLSRTSREVQELNQTANTLPRSKVTVTELRTSPAGKARTPSAIRQTLGTVDESFEMPLESDKFKISTNKRSFGKHEENMITSVNQVHTKGSMKMPLMDVSTEKGLIEKMEWLRESTSESINTGDEVSSTTEADGIATSSLVFHEQSNLERVQNKSSIDALSGESSPEATEESNSSGSELNSKTEENGAIATNAKEIEATLIDRSLPNSTATELFRREHELPHIDPPINGVRKNESQARTQRIEMGSNGENHDFSLENPQAPSNSQQIMEKVTSTLDNSDDSSSLESESIEHTQVRVVKAVSVKSHKDDSWNRQPSNEIVMGIRQIPVKHIGIENLNQNQQSLTANTETHVITPIEDEASTKFHATTERFSSINDLNSNNFLSPPTSTEPNTIKHESHNRKIIDESFEEAHVGQVESIESQLTTSSREEMIQTRTSHELLNIENPNRDEETPHTEMSREDEIETSTLSQSSGDFIKLSSTLSYANPSTLRPVREAVAASEESSQKENEMLKLTEFVTPTTTTATQRDRDIQTTSNTDNKNIEQLEDSVDHSAFQEPDSMVAETNPRIQEELETLTKELANEHFENVDRSPSEIGVEESLASALEERTGLIRVTSVPLQGKISNGDSMPIQSVGLAANEGSPILQADHDFTTVDSTTAITTVSSNTSSNDIHTTTTPDIISTTLTPATITPDEDFATTEINFETTTAHTTQLDIHFQDQSVNIESNDLRVARNALQATQYMKSAYNQKTLTNSNSETVTGYPPDATDIPKMEIAVFGNLDLTVLFCPKDCSEIHEHKYDKSVLGDRHVVGVQWDPANSNKTMSLRTV
ncbi:PREDICTED: serine-rich adhesin for platelets-like [Rhagoletis zephyria]|uniref:serine-rich adhesin for platelets-like n=1 Tax=Rhagoletis zephyria TaxID=28612 RepID=UPI0008117642|nr:PREDICTED: serine-rich adhesin for platelets-like [Rhagoletis zephyria]